MNNMNNFKIARGFVTTLGIAIIILIDANALVEYPSTENRTVSDIYNTNPFTLNEEKTCSLKDSCVVENVTAHSISLRWPCCAGTFFDITSNSLSENYDGLNPDRYFRNYEYRCRYISSHDGRAGKKAMKTTNCSATFEDYYPYRSYKIEIKTAKESCSFVETTLPEVPEMIEAKAVESDKIRLSWRDSICRDQIKPLYKISWASPDGHLSEDSKFEKQYLIDNLMPNTKYTITLCACNNQNHKMDEKFCSERTSIQATTNPGGPSEVRNLQVKGITSDELLLSWQRPLTPRGPINGYVIKLYNFQEERVEIVPPSANEYLFKRLNPWTHYNTTVFAFNNDTNEEGEQMMIDGNEVTLSSKTEAGAPSAPRDVMFSSEERILKWKRPFSPRGPIDGYIIRVKTDESEVILNGSIFNHKITDFPPSTNYTIAIFAYNLEGQKRLDGDEVVLPNSIHVADEKDLELYKMKVKLFKADDLTWRFHNQLMEQRMLNVALESDILDMLDDVHKINEIVQNSTFIQIQTNKDLKKINEMLG